MGADGAVLYARVSSAKQAAGDKTSLEDQSLARRGVAEPLGLTVVAVIPKVQSPSKELERPGFNQACGIIEDGRASWLLVWDVTASPATTGVCTAWPSPTSRARP